MISLSAAIRAALLTGDARGKVRATRALARDWRAGALAWDFAASLPERPAWPRGLAIVGPGQVPKRGGEGSKAVAFWHSLAHIEFVAIDLALDMAGRFGAQMGPAFVSDFLAVAADEAMHFAVIDRKLRSFGSAYGALPVHAGLWEAAHATRHDVLARLAVVPMVLEARGLDVTPAMRDRVAASGDSRGARVLQRILDDEIRHVSVGTKHFVAPCEKRRAHAPTLWKTLAKRYFRGELKAPFNDSARLAAGLSRDFYGGVA